MTTSQRLKAGLIAYLNEVKPNADIAVVDAKQRVEIDLPTLAIEVTNAGSHSAALPHINRCTVEIKLRTHSGDEAMLEVESCIDQIESALNDPTTIKDLIVDQIKVDYWLYGGSTQEWDESVLEVTFEAECLCSRI